MQPHFELLTVEHPHQFSSGYFQLISSFVHGAFTKAHMFQCFSKCIYRGHKYKSGFFLTFNSCNLKLFQIIEIVVVSGCKLPYFVCKPIQINTYLHHYMAYSVSLPAISGDKDDVVILCVNKFNGSPFNLQQITKDSNSNELINVFRAKEYY